MKIHPCQARLLPKEKAPILPTEAPASARAPATIFLLTREVPVEKNKLPYGYIALAFILGGFLFRK